MVKVSVIIPAYNEENYIEECFQRVIKVMKGYGKPFEVILEEDGSTDSTPQIIDKLAKEYPFVKALHFPRKMGKGFGVRMCLMNASGEIIVLIDADAEYPPERIPALLDKIGENDIVVGSRKIWKNRKAMKVRGIRALASRVYGILIKNLFGVNSLEDLQTGLKAFKREVIEKIQPLTSNGFEIDSEILIKAVRKGFKVGFIPITYTYKGNSKVNVLLDPLKMFFSMLRWKVNGELEFKERGG